MNPSATSALETVLTDEKVKFGDGIANRFRDAEVEDALTWLTTDPAYQSGVNALGKPNG
mgnify:CR=1 FL=1